MADLRVNGISTGARIYELKLPAGKTLSDLKQTASTDGLDQVYFESGERAYVAEGRGLNLSGLNQRGFMSSELILNGGTPAEHSVIATIKLVDDEVNTAREGAALAARKSLGVVASGLGGSAVLAGAAGTKIGPALSEASRGVQAVETGFKSISAGIAPINQGIQVSTGAARAVLSVNQSPALPGWMGRMSSEFTKVLKLPAQAEAVHQGLGLIQEGAGLATQGTHAAQAGLTHFNTSARISREGARLLKSAGVVAGVTAVVAGTVAGAGAVYGATRAAHSNALEAYKLKTWRNPLE
jgi:hypothetical protein